MDLAGLQDNHLYLCLRLLERRDEDDYLTSTQWYEYAIWRHVCDTASFTRARCVCESNRSSNGNRTNYDFREDYA
jgi:hypothetical protein